MWRSVWLLDHPTWHSFHRWMRSYPGLPTTQAPLFRSACAPKFAVASISPPPAGPTAPRDLTSRRGLGALPPAPPRRPRRWWQRGARRRQQGSRPTLEHPPAVQRTGRRVASALSGFHCREEFLSTILLMHTYIHVEFRLRYHMLILSHFLQGREHNSD